MNSSKKKKTFLLELSGIVSVFLCILVLAFTIHTKEKYTVSFNSVGGTYITSSRVLANKKVEKPVNPVKEGYSFIGWYSGNSIFDFNTSITSNINLVAKWEKIEDSNFSLKEEKPLENIRNIQIGEAVAKFFNKLTEQENGAITQ